MRLPLLHVDRPQRTQRGRSSAFTTSSIIKFRSRPVAALHILAVKAASELLCGPSWTDLDGDLDGSPPIGPHGAVLTNVRAAPPDAFLF